MTADSRATGAGATAGKALAIAAGAVVALWPAVHGGWLWDDDLEVLHNPLIRDAAGWWKPWITPAGMDYFPLKDTLHWLQWQLWGDAVVGYHLSNLGLHLLAALLLWRLLGKLGVRQGWIGGLLFAIHPVAVESVAWISEFKNTASLPPLLFSLCAWVDYDDRRKASDLFWSLAWFVAAMLCKTSVVMLPFVLLLLAWWRRRRIGWADLRATAPFFAVSLALGLVTLKFQGHRAMGDAAPAAALAERITQAGWSILAYARACVLPFQLSPVYEPFHTMLPAFIPWAVVAATLTGFWFFRAGWGRHALLGAGWFLLNLVPVLGLVPLSYLRVAPRADHFVYISLAGITALAGAAFAAGWEASWGRPPLRRLALTLAGATVVVAFILVSRGHAAIFRDESVLWRETVARSPDAWLARNNLGKVLMGEGSPQLAREQFEAALRLGPVSAEVHTNLGNALDEMAQPAAAQDQYRAALQIDPAFVGAHYGLGRSLLRAGRPAEAGVELQKAVSLDPAHAAAHNNLGLALAQLGHAREAIVEYERALQLDPRLPEAYLNLGNTHFRSGQIDEAVTQYRKALEINPSYGAAHRNLSAALRALGQEAEARAEAEAARKLGVP